MNKCIFFLILAILLIIVIFIIVRNCKVSYFSEIQSLTNNNYEHIKIYNNAFNSVYNILSNIKYKWFITDGTLISAIRYGELYSQLSSINFILTDTDLDIMICCENINEWYDNILPYLITNFMKNSIWKRYKKYELANVKDAKITFYTDYNAVKCSKFESDLHVDIHVCIINKDKNIIYISEKKNIEYPFEIWNGQAPYNGLLVNNENEFGKALINNKLVPCPYYYLKWIMNTRNHIYHKTKNPVHLPYGGIVNDKCINSNHNLSINDKELLKIYAYELYKKNVANFLSFYPTVTCKLPTIVTGYWKLNKSKKVKGLQLDSQFNDGNSQYMHYAKYLLQYRGGMIIVTDEENIKILKSFRNNLPTYFIIQNYKDFPIYNSRLAINEFNISNNKNSEFYKTWKTKYDINIRALFTIYFSKIEMLNMSNNINPFNSDYFIWQDIGSIRTKVNLSPNWPNIKTVYSTGEKISYLINPVHKKHEWCQKTYQESKNDLTPLGIYVIGTSIIAHKNKIPTCYQYYYNKLSEMEDNLMGDDESYNSFVVCNNRPLFNLIEANENHPWGSSYFYLFEYLK